MANYFIPFEIAIYAMFIVLFLVQFRKPVKERNFFVLFAGLAFGIILEIGDIAIWHTYNYGSHFLIYVVNVPLAIGVAWAVILHTSMLVSNKIGEKYNIPLFVRPFIDALLVFSIDIVLDVVSVKYGGWSWLISSNQEWFGVPYENFVGWMSVALIFSMVVRLTLLSETKVSEIRIKKVYAKIYGFAARIATPFVSYVFLVGFFIFQAGIVHTIYFLKTGNSDYASGASWLNPAVIYDSTISFIKGSMFLLIVLLLLWLFMYYIHRNGALKKNNFDLRKIKLGINELSISFLVIMVITSAIFVVLFLTGMYAEYPLLVIVQGFVILLNFLAFLVAFNSDSKKVR